MFRIMLAAAGVALLLTAAGAADKSKSEIKEAAEMIASMLSDEKQTRVAFDLFRAPPQYASTGGLGLSKDLIEELKKLEIECDKKAPLALMGIYALDEGKLTAKVKCRLVDANGKDQAECTFFLREPAYLARLFGLSIDLPLDKPAEERKQVIREAIAIETAGNFKPVVKETAVKPSATSVYAVEIWVLKPGINPNDAKDSDYVARDCHIGEDGLAYVDLKRGEIFAIRLINNSEFNAAATITLDGVNSFGFQNSTQFNNYFIPRNVDSKPMLIKGWFRNEEQSDAFKIGEYAHGAFQELNLDDSSVGAITVTYAAAWEYGTNPPSDEPPPLMVARGGGKDAVVRGPEVIQKFQVVASNIGVIRTAITIRYQP